MNPSEVVIRFDNVSFKYNDKKVTLNEASFSVRKDSKITIMGQNGAGKTTIFKLLTGEIKPTEGQINIKQGAKIAIAQQMVPQHLLEHSITEYFATAFTDQKYGIEGDIKKVMRVVNLDVPIDRKVKDLSGGQKARLLLAFALIQEPDILLLDEPTNNLDHTGIDHLTQFLMFYEKTVLVISHDADFLNVFSDGVLNLDVFTHKVEQFVGNYYDVVEQIAQQIERERLANSRLQKSIKDRFEKVNKLGGKSVAMNRLANKVRAQIDEDRETMVDMRREDKTIADFNIPAQHTTKWIIKIKEVEFLKDHSPISRNVDFELWRKDKLIVSGPNGIGKSTLIKSFLDGKGVTINPDVRIGYYSQDFSELDFSQTAFESLESVALVKNNQAIYGAAAKFLLTSDLLHNKVGSLSDGQKGLLCYARFMLQEPGLLIMDEPTNHINFRHIPVIALKDFEGGLILISHVPSFVEEIKVNLELDLPRLM